MDTPACMQIGLNALACLYIHQYTKCCCVTAWGRNQMLYSFYCSTIALLGYVLCSELTTFIYCDTVWWREGRVCKECGSGEVEDVGHFVL